MRILVTGAAGFIGSTIVELLRDRGHEVVAVDLLLDRAHASRPAWVGEDLHIVDVRDEAALAKLLRGVDAVCHQAAMVGLGLTIHDAPDYASHNVVGTASLVSAMARAEVAWLVQASSMVVYGGGREVCPVHGDVATRPRTTEDLAAGCFEPRCGVCGRQVSWGLVGEDAPLKPQNAYAATKLAQEHVAVAWAEQSGGRAISLRYHNVYGPRMPRDTPYAGVASIFRSALAAGRAPQVYEDGLQMRDFVHVRDVAHANLAALEGLTSSLGRTPGHRAYNVASGRPRTVLDLATALARELSGPEPAVVGGGRPGDVRHVVADPARIRTELGFAAQVGFDEGIAEFAAAPMRS
ncbi:MAG TPA: NAD-dependent epimerase/dehydratase family protein [Propionicimonas sp.]|nr:NAD-dependent epimerase/dehydratase family protein [Propionicimonas sp.]